MSMAPVAAACSRILSGASAPAIQSIAWPGPAMKPSSDIALLTTTLPVAVLVSLILFLAATAYADAVTTVDIGLPGRPASPGHSRVTAPVRPSAFLRTSPEAARGDQGSCN